jgi:hypothetical protein
MATNDDPRAPYKVFEGDELRGTFFTRAEARRCLQQIESGQENRSEPRPPVRMLDRDGHVAS